LAALAVTSLVVFAQDACDNTDITCEAPEATTVVYEAPVTYYEPVVYEASVVHNAPVYYVSEPPPAGGGGAAGGRSAFDCARDRRARRILWLRTPQKLLQNRDSVRAARRLVWPEVVRQRVEGNGLSVVKTAAVGNMPAVTSTTP